MPPRAVGVPRTKPAGPKEPPLLQRDHRNLAVCYAKCRGVGARQSRQRRLATRNDYPSAQRKRGFTVQWPLPTDLVIIKQMSKMSATLVYSVP